MIEILNLNPIEIPAEFAQQGIEGDWYSIEFVWYNDLMGTQICVNKDEIVGNADWVFFPKFQPDIINHDLTDKLFEHFELTP